MDREQTVEHGERVCGEAQFPMQNFPGDCADYEGTVHDSRFLPGAEFGGEDRSGRELARGDLPELAAQGLPNAKRVATYGGIVRDRELLCGFPTSCEGEVGFEFVLHDSVPESVRFRVTAYAVCAEFWTLSTTAQRTLDGLDLEETNREEHHDRKSHDARLGYQLEVHDSDS